MVRRLLMRDPPMPSRFERRARRNGRARLASATIEGFSTVVLGLSPMAASCSVLTSRPALTTVPFPHASQVNIPKAKKSFCKKCKKHAPHKVTQYKTGKASLYAQGESRE